MLGQPCGRQSDLSPAGRRALSVGWLVSDGPSKTNAAHHWTAMDKFDVVKRLYPARPGAVSLNPPATLAEVEAAEAAMGCRLPDGVREAYLRFNGVSWRTFESSKGPYLFLSGLDWISLERMVNRRQFMAQVSREIIEQGHWPDTLIDRNRFVSGVESGALMRPPDNGGHWVSPASGEVIYRLQDAGL